MKKQLFRISIQAKLHNLYERLQGLETLMFLSTILNAFAVAFIITYVSIQYFSPPSPTPITIIEKSDKVIDKPVPMVYCYVGNITITRPATDRCPDGSPGIPTYPY